MATALASSTLAAQLPPVVAVTPKSVVISEVSWDPLGPDAGFEWIEFAVSGGSSDFSLNGYTVVDEQDSVLYTFGNSKVEGGDTVLLCLGDVRPGVAGLDLSSGDARVLFRGPTTSDLLGNTSGALGLRKPGGALHDFVAWGQGSAPSSSPLYQTAVSLGKWPSGEFVDIAFDAASPTHPGYTIGRDRYAHDNDRADDWAGNGGKHGVGASPAGPNSVDVENVSGLLQLAQETVNAAFLAYTMNAGEALRFPITSSDVTNIQTTNFPGFHYAVDADHSFVIEDTHAGSGPETWTGTLNHEFKKLGARSFETSLSGQIVSPGGDSLSVDYSIVRSGFGSKTITETQTASFALDLYGSIYPFDSTNVTESTLVGNRKVDQVSTRTESNWGGGPSATVTLAVSTEEESDTTSTFEFEIDGTPIWDISPSLGGSSSIGNEVMSIVGSGRTTMSSPEEFVVSYESMELFQDGYKLLEVTSADPATFTISRTSGVPGDSIGSLSVASRFPLRDPGYGNIAIEFGHSDTTTHQLTAAGKRIAFSQPEYEGFGSSWATGSFYVDPPFQTQIRPTNLVSNTTSYGINGSSGGSSIRDVIRVGGSVAIMTTCVIAGASAAGAGAAAAPVSGGASFFAGLAAGWKSALACGAASIAWAEFF